MIEKNSNGNSAPAEILVNFPESLSGYSDDEKCKIIGDAAENFMNSGSQTNLIHAQSILVYATQHFFGVEDSNSKALVYYRLGKLYEFYQKDYVKAYTAYKKYELNNTVYSGVHSILLRVILLRDNFVYSEEAEKELKLSYGETDLGLRRDRIYENIGSLIVARKEGNTELSEKLVKRIRAIVKADRLFFLDAVFKKDSVPDSLNPPQKLLDFVNALESEKPKE